MMVWVLLISNKMWFNIAQLSSQTCLQSGYARPIMGTRCYVSWINRTHQAAYLRPTYTAVISMGFCIWIYPLRLHNFKSNNRFWIKCIGLLMMSIWLYRTCAQVRQGIHSLEFNNPTSVVYLELHCSYWAIFEANIIFKFNCLNNCVNIGLWTREW